MWHIMQCLIFFRLFYYRLFWNSTLVKIAKKLDSLDKEKELFDN